MYRSSLCPILPFLQETGFQILSGLIVWKRRVFYARNHINGRKNTSDQKHIHAGIKFSVNEAFLYYLYTCIIQWVINSLQL